MSRLTIDRQERSFRKVLFPLVAPLLQYIRSAKKVKNLQRTCIHVKDSTNIAKFISTTLEFSK